MCYGNNSPMLEKKLLVLFAAGLLAACGGSKGYVRVPERFEYENGVEHTERKSIRTLRIILEEYGSIINEAAEEEKIEPTLVTAVMYIESRGNPRALSCTGAAGLMQFVVDTAQAMGLSVPEYELRKRKFRCNGHVYSATRVGCNRLDDSLCDYGDDERFQPEEAVPAAAAYLRKLLDRYDEDAVRALRAYGGDGNGEKGYAEKVLETKRWIEGVIGGPVG